MVAGAAARQHAPAQRRAPDQYVHVSCTDGLPTIEKVSIRRWRKRLERGVVRHVRSPHGARHGLSSHAFVTLAKPTITSALVTAHDAGACDLGGKRKISAWVAGGTALRAAYSRIMKKQQRPFSTDLPLASAHDAAVQPHCTPCTVQRYKSHGAPLAGAARTAPRPYTPIISAYRNASFSTRVWRVQPPVGRRFLPREFVDIRRAVARRARRAFHGTAQSRPFAVRVRVL
eukprot:IDg19396t1